jgi:hypothetical protein
MNFLNTFFGQIFRKSDIDFQNEGMRSSVVNTHIDFTTSNGGIVKGLDAKVSIDNKSVLVKPGVFYSKGVYSSSNSLGGGERCEIFEDQYVTRFPETGKINGQDSYILIYAKTISSNTNPDPSKSQNTATSKNIQTDENIPIRSYTAGVIVATNPLLPSEIANINGVPLMLIQVNSNGEITYSDTSVRSEYSIAGLVNIAKKQVNEVAIEDGFVLSRMIGDDQITNVKIAGSGVWSIDVARWDGSSSGTTSGSGVATGHIKDRAITSLKISPTGSLDKFSTTNHVFNGSFEVDPNAGTGDSDLVGWNVYDQISSVTSYLGAPAGAFRSSDEFYSGFYSAKIVGADITQTPGGVAASVAFYQDIPFSGIKLNDEPVSAFFYMKTDSDIPMNVSGVSGITSTVQFMSSGTLVGEQYQIANYTGSQIDWTKFELSSPVVYNGSSVVDGVRFMISGVMTSAANIYIDDVFVGITNITPKWSASASDSEYSDTLYKTNIISTNLGATNSTINNLSSSNITSVSPSGSFAGTTSNPFDIIYTDALFVGGVNIVNESQRFIAFTGSSISGTNVYSGIFSVPSSVDRITVEMVGAGGGGAAGSSDSAATNVNSEGRLYAVTSPTTINIYSGNSIASTSPSLLGGFNATSSAISSISNLVVEGSSNGVVVILDKAARTFTRTVPTAGGTLAVTPISLSSFLPSTTLAYDVAIDPARNIYIATSNGLLRYNPITNIGTIISTTVFDSVACDLNSNLYATVSNTNTVHKFNTVTGLFVTSFAVVMPSAGVNLIRCASNGYLVMAKDGGNDVYISDSAGSLITSFSTVASAAGTIKTIRTDRSGYIYIRFVSSGTKIFKYDITGSSATGSMSTPILTTSYTIYEFAVGSAGTAIANTDGGGGGGAGAYIKSSISVIPLSSLLLSVGVGGSGGIAGTSGSSISTYLGQPGSQTSISTIAGSPILIAAGGQGGGSLSGYVADAGQPGGSRFYMDNIIGTTGNVGYSGNVTRNNPSQTTGGTPNNGGGDGGSSPYLGIAGGVGGVGWTAGGSHSLDPAMDGASGSFGSGGGGGGGSISPLVLAPSGSRGGNGGPGGNGIILIYY